MLWILVGIFKERRINVSRKTLLSISEQSIVLAALMDLMPSFGFIELI